MKWRDVNDKLPPNDNAVLCWDEATGLRTGFYSKIGTIWCAEKNAPPHGQPLPAPPVTED